MEVIIQNTPAEATTIAAQHIARLLQHKPNAVLGLATGSTPLALYRELIALQLDWRAVRTFNLDEYLGIAATHPQSYHYFMHQHLFRHININPANVYIPDGLANDVPQFCLDYETAIRQAGGIDVQILGIGSDGHIGFNEPSSSLVSRTRIKTLTPRTRQDNARFFSSVDEVPMHAITMGVGTIMEARQVLLFAFGAHKAHAISEAIEGPLSANNPASILQMHADARVYIDAPAASQLKRIDYYKWVFDNKPDWLRP